MTVAHVCLLVTAVIVLAVDAFVAWALYGLGAHGLRAGDGWGMLGVGIVLVAAVGANLLFLLVLLLRTATRRTESNSELVQ